MAACTYCGIETQLHVNDVPMCVHCLDLTPERRAVRAQLFQQWGEAVKRADSANNAFMEVTGTVPRGMPDSDGIQRIKNVSRQLSVARKEMITAHDRLNDFLERGIVPDDLKRAGEPEGERVQSAKFSVDSERPRKLE